MLPTKSDKACERLGMGGSYPDNAHPCLFTVSDLQSGTLAACRSWITAAGCRTVWSGRCARLCLTSSPSSFTGCSRHALRFFRRAASALASSAVSAHGSDGSRTSESLETTHASKPHSCT